MCTGAEAESYRMEFPLRRVLLSFCLNALCIFCLDVDVAKMARDDHAVQLTKTCTDVSEINGT